MPVDVSVLLETADLLYSGPWLAERWLAFGDKLTDDPAVDPTVRTIVRRGAGLTASETFAGFDRLAELTRQSEPLWTRIDALLLPVTDRTPTAGRGGRRSGRREQPDGQVHEHGQSARSLRCRLPRSCSR